MQKPVELFASVRKHEWQQKKILELGKIIRETIPGVPEATKWHMPTWLPICYLGSNQKEVYLGIFRWQELPFRLHKVTHKKKVIARIDFVEETPIPEKEIRELLLAVQKVTATDKRPWRVH